MQFLYIYYFILEVFLCALDVDKDVMSSHYSNTFLASQFKFPNLRVLYWIFLEIKMIIISLNNKHWQVSQPHPTHPNCSLYFHPLDKTKIVQMHFCHWKWVIQCINSLHLAYILLKLMVVIVKIVMVPRRFCYTIIDKWNVILPVLIRLLVHQPLQRKLASSFIQKVC